MEGTCKRAEPAQLGICSRSVGLTQVWYVVLTLPMLGWEFSGEEIEKDQCLHNDHKDQIP